MVPPPFFYTHSFTYAPLLTSKALYNLEKNKR